MTGFLIRCAVAALALFFTIYLFATGSWGWGISMIFVLALIIATFFIHERMILGLNAMRKGDLDKATYHINKITHPHLMPKRQHAYILFLQSSMGAQAGGLAKAEAPMRKALELGLKDKTARAQAYFMLASICAQSGRIPESKSNLAEAKKLDTAGMLKEHIDSMSKQMNMMPSKNQMRMQQMAGFRQKPSKRK